MATNCSEMEDENYEYLYVTSPEEVDFKGDGSLYSTGVKCRELSDEVKALKEKLHEYEESIIDHIEKSKDHEAEKMFLIRERRKEKDTLTHEARKWKDVSIAKDKTISILRSQIKVLEEREKALIEQLKNSENRQNNEEFERQKVEVAQSKTEIDKLKQQIVTLEKVIAEKEVTFSKRSEEKLDKMSLDIAALQKGQDDMLKKLNKKDDTHREMLDMIKEKDNTVKEMLHSMKERDRSLMDVITNLKEKTEPKIKTDEEQIPTRGRRMSEQLSYRSSAYNTTAEKQDLNLLQKSEPFANKPLFLSQESKEKPRFERIQSLPDVRSTMQSIRRKPANPWQNFFQGRK